MKTTLDLALAYYKLSEYKNPLRIEGLFSYITVIIRDLTEIDEVTTKILKNETKKILAQVRKNFNASEFDTQWIEFYADERYSIQLHMVGKRNDQYPIPNMNTIRLQVLSERGLGPACITI